MSPAPRPRSRERIAEAFMVVEDVEAAARGGEAFRVAM
jgi:hypothetical protein